ncbi:MAG: purple acid phosphatase family protein [Promethearchaeota archaeon]
MRKLKIKRCNCFTFILVGLLVSTLFIHLSNLVSFNHSIIYKSTEKLDYHVKLSAPLTPTGIRITAVNDSSNSMVITWYTTANASDPKVVYSTDPTLTNNLTVIPTSKYIGSGYNTYIYNANLKNLEPDTIYHYKISSDSSNEREVFNFTATHSRNATYSKFLLFGDSRTQIEQRSELANKIMENFDDIDFTVHTGDIIEDGRIQTQWNEYFENVEMLSKNIPGYYIEGNHERTDGYMYDNIPLPSNGLNSHYYNFSIGPVSFIGLNTERDISEQTVWLEKTLRFIHQDNNTLWKIVYMHKPIFNSRYSRSDETELITAWCPLFEEYDVDFVFAGHNHYYERSYPMNFLKEYDDSEHDDFKNPKIPMYFITGGAGAPLYTRDDGYPFYEPPSYTAHYNSTYHFIIAEVVVDDLKEETILTFETWAMPNDYSGIYLIDNLTVLKKGAYVNIHTPTTDQLFGKNSPSFNVTVDKVKLKPTWFTLNTTWYSIDEGKTNFTYAGEIGTINQTAWDLHLNDTVIINFYANDSIGNIEYNSVMVRKDFIPPNISIISPIPNQLFGQFSLNFSLIIDESFLNLTWYTIDEGISNYTFTGTTGTINQTAWDSIENGIVTIVFYANDSLGNLGSTEIVVRKDSTGPNITIAFPNANETYGINAPYFLVFIKDDHLHSMWYSFNESDVRIIFTENGTINQEEWEKLSNGMHKLIFYANDSVGNTAFVGIIINKNIPENGVNRDLTILIGTVISFIIFLTVGVIAYIYILIKRIKYKET